MCVTCQSHRDGGSVLTIKIRQAPPRDSIGVAVLNIPEGFQAPEKIMWALSSTAQNITSRMIDDVANDFGLMENSATTAGAVLDTLIIVSANGTSLTAHSQVVKQLYV